MVSMFGFSRGLGAFPPKYILGAFPPIFKLGAFSPRLRRLREPAPDGIEPGEFDTNLTPPANNSGRPRRPRARFPAARVAEGVRRGLSEDARMKLKL